MDLGLQSRVALVTGATRGLGLAIASRLAAEGANLVLASRSDASDVIAELPDSTGNHVSFQANLDSREGCQSLLDFLAGEKISPDVIVNNVGGNLELKDPLMGPEDFWKIMEHNLQSSLVLNAALIPDMVKRRWGRVCHVSSISSLENQGVPAYSSAKAAMNAYIRGVGRYLAPSNVILTGVLPGAVFTEGGYWDQEMKRDPERVKNYIEDRMAIRRFGKPSEIADLVAFLVSDLSSFMVGSLVLADGGQGRVIFDGGA